MNYIVLALTAEGPTDYRFLCGVIWRTIAELAIELNVSIDVQEHIVSISDKNNDERILAFCRERDNVDLFFIHFDSSNNSHEDRRDAIVGAVQNGAELQCKLRKERVVSIWTCREMEAWVLADPDAIARSLGFEGWPDRKEIIWNMNSIEQISDPKRALSDAVSHLTSDKISAYSTYFEIAGQEISLLRLARVPSYRAFREETKRALGEILR